MAAINTFQGTYVAPITWVDIGPSNSDDCPERYVGLTDIMACIGGFQGEPYPGLGPKNCP
jgi:hypothetical protein